MLPLCRWLRSLVQEIFIQRNTKVAGDGAQVVIGDCLADQAAAHGQHLDVDLGALFNGVGQTECDVKIRARGKQAVLRPDGLGRISSFRW